MATNIPSRLRGDELCDRRSDKEMEALPLYASCLRNLLLGTWTLTQSTSLLSMEVKPPPYLRWLEEIRDRLGSFQHKERSLYSEKNPQVFNPRLYPSFWVLYILMHYCFSIPFFKISSFHCRFFRKMFGNSEWFMCIYESGSLEWRKLKSNCISKMERKETDAS